jgi:pimeloyl-ACP methyl ester carboxylesterase
VGLAGHRGLDACADQVVVVAEHAGEPIHLVGFSWGGAHAAQLTPELAGWITRAVTAARISVV